MALIQSLVRKGEVSDAVANYGHLIVDECHHLPAVSFRGGRATVESEICPRPLSHRHPERRSPPDRVHAMRSRALPRWTPASKRPFGRLLIRWCSGQRRSRPRNRQPLALRESKRYMDSWRTDSARNDLIFDDVLLALEAGRSPVILTERKDHLLYFADRLSKFAKNVIVFHGGMKAKAQKEADRALKEVLDSEERVLLATGRYLGEGFDDARLDTLFLTMPISWRGLALAVRRPSSPTASHETRRHDLRLRRCA